MILLLATFAGAVIGQCEQFVAPTTPLERYCESEIKQFSGLAIRTLQMIVRDPKKNPLYLNGRLTCAPSQHQSLHAVAQFVSSRNCYQHTKNFFCGTMIPECNGTHFYEPCQRMCKDLTEKCQLYSFAGDSIRCPDASDFGVFNCKKFSKMYGLETNRCRHIKTFTPLTTIRPVTTSIASRTLLPPRTLRPNTEPITENQIRTTIKPTISTITLVAPANNTSVDTRPTRPSTVVSTRPLVAATITTKALVPGVPMIEARDIKWKICISEAQIPGSLFYTICEWIRVFVRWRWRTFRKWTDIMEGIASEEYDLDQAECPKLKPVRCSSFNRRKCLADVHNCQYCYCEIDPEDTYGTVLEYWTTDNDYWNYRLQYQWFHLALKYPDFDPLPNNRL